MGFTRLNGDVTVFELGGVRLVRIIVVLVVVELVLWPPVSAADLPVEVLLLAVMVMVDDDGLVSPLSHQRRLVEERVRRAARLAAAVNVLGPDAKLVSPQRRQPVNHVRGRVAP